MDAFVWDRHFVTGLAIVDDQHHALVNLINRLGEARLQPEGSRDGTLATAFGQLADYARFHFAEEEALMTSRGVDARHCAHHHEIHQGFMKQVASMWETRHAAEDPVGGLQDFLVAWLSSHILGDDQSLARQISRMDRGESAAAAFEAESLHQDNATGALLLALRQLYRVLSQKNRDLVEANRRLEERVAERTEALAELNRSLTEANRRLERASRTDGLLGIANRSRFDEVLRREWQRGRRTRRPISLLMIDVDHFKRFNDRHGHPAGDECLRSVAKSVVTAAQRADDLVARYGGEELAVLLPNTDLAGARLVAERIQGELEARHIVHGDSPVADRVTVSIGVATGTPDGARAADCLVQAADRALYAAKEGGRNRACVDSDVGYSPKANGACFQGRSPSHVE